MSKTFVKDPADILDYTVNWVSWLNGDTISTSSWSADTGLTVDSDSNSTTAATAFVSGGTSNTTYGLYNTIVTAAGRTKKAAIYIEVEALP